MKNTLKSLDPAEIEQYAKLIPYVGRATIANIQGTSKSDNLTKWIVIGSILLTVIFVAGMAYLYYLTGEVLRELIAGWFAFFTSELGFTTLIKNKNEAEEHADNRKMMELVAEQDKRIIDLERKKLEIEEKKLAQQDIPIYYEGEVI